MNHSDVTRMRILELLTKKVIALLLFAAFVVLILYRPETSPALILLVFAVYSVIGGLIKWWKIDNTTSIIPIFQRVKRYEKEMMGYEWEEEQRREFKSSLASGSGTVILAVFLLTVNWEPLVIDKVVIAFMLLILLLICFGQLYRARKIDQYPSEEGGRLQTINHQPFYVVIAIFIIIYSVVLIWVLLT